MKLENLFLLSLIPMINISDQQNGVIYCATNKISGKSYIGQSWNFEKRKYFHLYGKSGCQIFNRAMKKYGNEMFSWSILMDGINDQETMDLAEEWAIWYYMTLSPLGYNLRNGGSGNALLCEESRKKHKISTTIKNREIHKRESWKIKHAHGILKRSENKIWIENQKKAAKKTSQNEEWKIKIKEVGLNNSKNEVWKRKTAEGGAINAKKIICTSTGIIYKSIRSAAKETGVDASMIIRVCKKTTQKTAGGFTWEYWDGSK